jgi:hypothetical protein
VCGIVLVMIQKQILTVNIDGLNSTSTSIWNIMSGNEPWKHNVSTVEIVIKNPVGAIHINTSSCDFTSFNITLNENVISNATYN